MYAAPTQWEIFTGLRLADSRYAVGFGLASPKRYAKASEARVASSATQTGAFLAPPQRGENGSC